MTLRNITAAICCALLTCTQALAEAPTAKITTPTLQQPAPPKPLPKPTAAAPTATQTPPPVEQPEKKSTAKKVLTDAAVIAAIIAGSIALYKASSGGPCACPNDLARNGSRCGKRSAHDRSGGYDVICYASEVTKEMITGWRAENER